MATQRGGVALVFEGHRYNKVRDGKDGTVYWRCSRDRQCPGRAVTVNNRVKKANNKHNHPPEASLRNGHANHHHSHHGSNSSSSSNPVAFSVRTSSPVVAQNEVSLRMQNNNNSFSMQDVFEAQSAVSAASSFPSIVSETLKYLAFASSNPHMAAAFASTFGHQLPIQEQLARLNERRLESQRSRHMPTFIAGQSTNASLTFSPSLDRQKDQRPLSLHGVPCFAVESLKYFDNICPLTKTAN